MPHPLQSTGSRWSNRLSTLLLGLLLAIVGNALAQPTLSISPNTRLVGSGALHLVYSGGTITNNGSIGATTGQFTLAGATTYGGNGSATVGDLTFAHAGASTLNSELSVTNRAVLSTGTALNANGKLYLRTDQFPNAELVNNGILTGTVLGLLTKATVTTGTAPYASTLSVNMSGSVVRYQWQSSADNSQWTDVAGATQPTYTATVNATTYYRCLLTTTNTAYSQTTPAVRLTFSPTNSAPVATANPNQAATVSQPFTYTVNAFTDAETPNSLTYTASISPANGFSFDPGRRTLAGTPGMAGASSVTVTATDPGGLSASTSFTITVSPATVVSGPFAITGVTTLGCTAIGASKRVISFTPQYSGLNGQPISFSVVSELVPTTNPGPYSLQLYTDNPVIVLKAVQSGTPGVASFSYNWLAICNGGVTPPPSVTNTAPTLATPVGNQMATAGQFYTLSVAAVFTDAETPNALTLSASGLPAGLNLTGTTLSGTTSQTGVSTLTLTATDPGNLSTSTSFVLTVTAPTSPTSTAPFAITGVSTITCTTIVAGRIDISFTPRYTGLNGSPVTFSVANELAPTTASGPYSLQLYVDNPTITLRAQQSGVATSFAYNWLVACQSGSNPTPPPGNTAPRVVQSVSPQSATVSVGYSVSLAGVFTDTETPNSLVLSATGLPAGLTLSGTTISGTPSASGVSTVTITATDPGNLAAATSFVLMVSPAGSQTVTPPVTPPSGFTITGVQTLSCVVMSASQRSVTFTPQYAGLNGQPISFSVVNELSTTTNPGPYTLRLYTDNPTITLKASQAGTAGVATFAYNWQSACGSGSRQGVVSEAGLEVIIHGNPVTTERVDIEVRGAQGQPLRLSVVNERGYPVSTVDQESAAEVERVQVRIGADAGLYFLQVSTPTQQKTIKLLKQ